MAMVKQRFPRERVEDVAAETRRQLEAAGVGQKLAAGARVAVTAGSRGIGSMPEVLRATAGYLRDCGAEPFVFAAMGSHGGGTPEGQRQVLSHLGITEAAIGAPVVVTDRTVSIGETEDGHTVWCDEDAARADGVLVINRVKPHTSFRAPLESGLFKMMAVGMGKVPGATQVHKLGASEIGSAIRSMGRLMLQRLPVIGGLAIIENGYEETARLVGLRPDEIEEREVLLLQEAGALLPRLPIHQVDLLIVDEMGKNFSGTGMDTNVIGRWRVPGLPEPESPVVTRLLVRRLSRGSGGNANGIGLADFTTRALADSVDWEATYLNVMTSTFLDRAKLPITLPDDRTAVAWALRSLHLVAGAPVRAVRIRNTLHLEEFWVSETLLPDLADKVEVTRPPADLSFDTAGNLLE